VIKKILTGCGCVDSNIGGGISPESLVLIYGEPETGQTPLAVQCAVNCGSGSLKLLEKRLD
jgi:KaiC/GvpD/RAD55 family RecA-like ATPase